MLYWYARDGATTLLLLLVARAVASLKEAEGHQHLAGGHGGGCEQMSPLPPRGPRNFLYIFNIHSCIHLICIPAHSLAPKMGITSAFIKTPMHWGGEWRLLEEAAEWGPKGRKARPKAESGVGFLGSGSKPHQLGGWHWCKQDQIFKTKIKTKITRPRPRPPEVNEGTWRI